ncbi:MAG: triple tyrosine motif-containing protein [Bacteroidota bacterium]
MEFKYKYSITTFFLLFFTIQLTAIKQGNPLIHNYFMADYQAGTQNWGFVQDDNGIIYCANNQGLLQFDGLTWELYPLPNKTIVRSILRDSISERIYVGGQNEVGYFYREDNGILNYQSIEIERLLPKKHPALSDIWQLCIVDENLVFRSNNKIYQYNLKNKKVSFYDCPSGYHFLHATKDGLLLHDNSGNFFNLKNGIVSRLNYTLPGLVISILEKEDGMVIITERRGAFKLSNDGQVNVWAPEIQSFLIENDINAVIEQANGNICIATSRAGLIILDKNGQRKNWISKANGLQNNLIVSVFSDDDQNLWLGLDNGIDFVNLNSALKMVYPDGYLEGTSYAIEIYQDQLYVGTSNGLYVSSWNNQSFIEFDEFQLIPGTEGQVWGLQVINDQLFMGHNDGAFIIENGKAKAIHTGPGHWLFVQPKENQNQLIAGTYNGLEVLQKQNGQWLHKSSLAGVQESCRFIVNIHDNEYWISHPYRGVFRLQLEDEGITQIDTFGVKEGLSSTLGNFVCSIWDKVVVCAETGIYEYIPEKDRFVHFKALEDLIVQPKEVRRLFEDPNGNIWYITKEQIGFLEIKTKGLEKKVTKYELPGIQSTLVAGFEHLYCYDDENVFIGALGGLLMVNPVLLKQKRSTIKTVITKVFLMNGVDSLLFSHQTNYNSNNNVLARFKHKENNFRFNFSGTHFQAKEKIRFRHQLVGYDKSWSDWSFKSEREYTNLAPGSYTFKVEANIPNIEGSEVAQFSFFIKSPWYANTTAYSVYFFTLLTLVGGLIIGQQIKFNQTKKEMVQEKEITLAAKQAQIKASESKIETLTTEKLNAEIAHKNRELTSTTMHLLQKSELINKVKNELDKLAKTSTHNPTQKELRRIKRLLQEDAQLDSEWEQFFYHFDQVHDQFFKRLKVRFPNLTPKDQKLCAYLRMNLSSKEIAPLLNISVRGVEISRYRLRRKLDLDTSTNLNEFMMGF